MANLIGLIDACLDVYDRSDFRPNPDGSTHCNQAVQSVGSVAFNYNGFRGMMADDMVKFLNGNPDWISIEMAQAQDYANKGSFVVAGLTAADLDQAHGHIVTIRPGLQVDSEHFKGLVPRCVNIGASDFIARGQMGVMTNLPCGINEAFQVMPKFYVLRSSL